MPVARVAAERDGRDGGDGDGGWDLVWVAWPSSRAFKFQRSSQIHAASSARPHALSASRASPPPRPVLSSAADDMLPPAHTRTHMIMSY